MKRLTTLLVSLGLVLTLGFATAQDDPGTILEVAQNTEQLSTLVDAVTAADLDEVLAGEEVLTVFAPTNEAFSAISEDQLSSLLEDQNAMIQIVGYHVLPGRFTSEELLSVNTATSLQSGELTFAVDDNGNITVNGANIVSADITASNGVVHLIDTVLMPDTMSDGGSDDGGMDSGSDDSGSDDSSNDDSDGGEGN
ncbi:MAG: fasciclin domain-containing protein [Trueperaceae bacterium]|nr:fasciclin domain-containing protein [Trueperaceae bacterium]